MDHFEKIQNWVNLTSLSSDTFVLQMKKYNKQKKKYTYSYLHVASCDNVCEMVENIVQLTALYRHTIWQHLNCMSLTLCTCSAALTHFAHSRVTFPVRETPSSLTLDFFGCCLLYVTVAHRVTYFYRMTEKIKCY